MCNGKKVAAFGRWTHSYRIVGISWLVRVLPIPCPHSILSSIPSPLLWAWYGLASNSEYSRWQQVAAALHRGQSAAHCQAWWNKGIDFSETLFTSTFLPFSVIKKHFISQKHRWLGTRGRTGPQPESTQQGAAMLSWLIFLGVHALLSNSLAPHLWRLIPRRTMLGNIFHQLCKLPALQRVQWSCR